MVSKMKTINREQDFFVHHRLLSAVKRVEFVSDRTSYIYIYMYSSRAINQMINREERDGKGMWHYGRGERCMFWWGNLRERDHLEDLGVDGRIILDGSSGSGMLEHGLD
jgi:hypothetical protein